MRYSWAVMEVLKVNTANTAKEPRDDQVFTDRMTVVKVSLNITGLVQKGPWVPGAKLDVKGTVRLTEADKDGTPKT